MNNTDFNLYKASFLDYVRDVKKLSNNTYKSYLLDLEQFALFWSQTPSYKVIDEALQSFFESLYQQEQKAASIARKVSCFNSFKQFLKIQNITIVVPIKRPAIRLTAPITLPAELISSMFETISHDQLATKRPLRERTIMELLYATGIKVSELIALEIGHIDFAQKTIVVRGRNKQERIIPFDIKVYNTLIEYLTYERAQVIDKQERLFLNHMSKPITARSIQRICKLFSEHLLNKTITPSILRNSCASHMLSKGASENDVQKMLGHKMAVSTIRYKKNNSHQA